VVTPPGDLYNESGHFCYRTPPARPRQQPEKPAAIAAPALAACPTPPHTARDVPTSTEGKRGASNGELRRKSPCPTDFSPPSRRGKIGHVGTRRQLTRPRPTPSRSHFATARGPPERVAVVRMMRSCPAPYNDNHGLTERLHDIRARWSLQLDTIMRAGPGAWLKKCIKQLDNTIFHTCDHKWEFYREPGPYGDRYEVCKRCGQAAFKRRDPIPAADLLPEIRRLLRSADAPPCTEHLFHESAQARMTREALRSIAEDGNTAAVAACLSCNQRNEAYTAPLHPEVRRRPRKRPRNGTHGTPPRPDGGQGRNEDRPIKFHTDQATQTEASGLLCRDEIPDEDMIESAVEEAMDTQQKSVRLWTRPQPLDHFQLPEFQSSKLELRKIFFFRPCVLRGPCTLPRAR
jgi:hypothetical protein